jgi:hypothetical protein
MKSIGSERTRSSEKILSRISVAMLERLIVSGARGVKREELIDEEIIFSRGLRTLVSRCCWNYEAQATEDHTEI